MALRLDPATLQAALLGYQRQLDHIETKMAELRRQLRGTAARSTVPTVAATGRTTRTRKHRMSAEGRARIAAAQRARWAKAKRAKKAAVANAGA